MIGMGAAFDFHLTIADALGWEKRSGFKLDCWRNISSIRRPGLIEPVCP
jgi:hypothetical protein